MYLCYLSVLSFLSISEMSWSWMPELMLQLTYLYKSMFSLLLYKDIHISLTLWKLTAKTLLHLNIFFLTCTFCSRIAS